MVEKAHHAHMMEIGTGQARALEFAELTAKNVVKAEKVESFYADANLIAAQTRVKHGHIANEGLKLNQVIEAGNLIRSKTDSLVLERQLTDTQNDVKRQQIPLVASKGKAFLQGIVLETRQLVSRNDQMMLVQEGQFEAMKGAGLFGSYKPKQ